MCRRLLICAFAALLAGSTLSCATAGFTPNETSMPAARAGLPPEERFFYDALADYGDWVLIEPYGWVFQPRVNWVAWRPYQYGFWAPTEVYGWTWVSTEPFGWATYHYGQWLYDRFQGWVWIPGLDWGPAWVAWQEGDGYVGWAPQMPSEEYWNAVPGGAFLFVPTTMMPSTDLSQHVFKQEQVRNQIGRLRPIVNPDELAGVRFNRGPAFEEIERVIGAPLPRVELEERAPLLAPPVGRAKPLPSGRDLAADSAAVMRRAAEEAAREARMVSLAKSRTPGKLPILRPLRPKKAPAGQKPPDASAPQSGEKPDSAPRERRDVPRLPQPGLERPASRDTSL
jgi:hypothetical protein